MTVRGAPFARGFATWPAAKQSTRRDPGTRRCANSPIFPNAKCSHSPSATRRRTAESSPITPRVCARIIPATAKVFAEMAAEENEHRRSLIDLFVSKFGDHIPLVRRQDIAGARNAQAGMAYPPASARQGAPPRARNGAGRGAVLSPRDRTRRPTRTSVNCWATSPRRKTSTNRKPLSLESEHLTTAAAKDEDENARRRFILQIIQPGLVGLMDGSVSTLAPVFAAAFATRDPWNAFLVGMAASLGAGISMGFAEALADDGKLVGARRAAAARRRLRIDDHGGRHRPYPAVPDPELRTRRRSSPASSSCSNLRRSPGSSGATWIPRRSRRPPR